MSKSKDAPPLAVAVLYIIMIGIVLWVFNPFASTDTPPTATPTTSDVSTGSEARISEDAFLALEGSRDALVKAVVAHDKQGIMELIIAGRVYMIDRGDRVLVLDRGLFSTKVRMLSGKSEGKAGLVAAELVQR